MMKKAYEIPKAEKVEFDYSETVTASSGHAYLLYTDKYTGCHETKSDPEVWVKGDADTSCAFEGN